MAVVLIITADQDKARSMASSLARGGHVPLIASDMQEAIAAAEPKPPQAIVLDATSEADLGKVVGDLVGQLRKSVPAPVIVSLDKAGLSRYEPTIGVDDFLVWPCTPEELVTRVGQALHRAGFADGRKLIMVGELTIDPERYQVWVSGVPVTLTYKEFELLKLLASNPGRVYSREQLLALVWGYDYFGGDRTVDVHIRRLRSKIEAWGHAFVETVRNVGYRLAQKP